MMAEVQVERWRKARKPHDCCECAVGIQRGDRYLYESGIWDGRPASFKTCRRCAELKERVFAERLRLNHYREPGIVFGDLHAAADELREEHGVEL